MVNNIGFSIYSPEGMLLIHFDEMLTTKQRQYLKAIDPNGRLDLLESKVGL